MPLHVFAVVRAIPFGLSAEGVASNAPPAKINGSTNGHVPSTGASSTVEHSKRIRTVRSSNRENNRQGRKTLALEEESGIR